MDLLFSLDMYARTTTRTSPGCKARPFCCKAMVDRVSARITCYSSLDLRVVVVVAVVVTVIYTAAKMRSL